jgi:integrase
VKALLLSFVNDGHPYKMEAARVWFKKLWRWAVEEDYATIPIMDAVRVKFEKHERTRVYTDDEIKATWRAAEQLSEPSKTSYVKLLILLAPRKRELAWMTWSHLDDADNPTLWTTPFELTKARKTASKKREYKTPLPPLAQRIIRGLPKGRPEDRVFPGVRVNLDRGGNKIVHDEGLKDELIVRGAPRDFMAHAWRHTIATHLQQATIERGDEVIKGYSDWEIGLVLNHSGGGVTAGYRHGFWNERKLEMLEEWATHIEGLVQPLGVRMLR